MKKNPKTKVTVEMALLDFENRNWWTDNQLNGLTLRELVLLTWWLQARQNDVMRVLLPVSGKASGVVLTPEEARATSSGPYRIRAGANALLRPQAK
jgi:hypothetical protein